MPMAPIMSASRLRAIKGGQSEAVDRRRIRQAAGSPLAIMALNRLTMPPAYHAAGFKAVCCRRGGLMPHRRTGHWATLLAVGLPLIVAGCAGTGSYQSPSDQAAAAAATKHVDALQLADTLKSEGNYASAVTMYQQAHQAKPGDILPLLGLGDSLLGV